MKQAAYYRLLAWLTHKLPKIKAICSFGTLVEFHRTIRRNIPDYRTLQLNGIVPSYWTFRLIIWKMVMIPIFAEKCCLHFQGELILF
jgi:hypothetical protein